LRIEFFERGGRAGVAFFFRYLRGKKFTRWSLASSRKALVSLKCMPERGFREEVYYISGLTKVPNLNVKSATNQRIVRQVAYPLTKNTWRNFQKNDNFAVRWSGMLTIQKRGTYRFSLKSDDGSRMFLNRKLAINNDGTHAFRQAESTMTVRNAKYRVLVEYFEKGGHAGILFRYMGPDTSSKMVYVSSRAVTAIYNPRLSRTPSLPKPKPKKVKKAGKKA